MNKPSLRVTTWAGLILVPLLIAAGQILFKLASRHIGRFDTDSVMQLWRNHYLLIALALYALGTVVWLYVLKTVPLTVAYSFMALTFCAVPLLAHYFLGETMSWRYAVGFSLIILGMVFINA